MYASIRRYKVRPGAATEIAQRVSQGFVPIISKAPGFAAYYIVDAGNDVIASVSVFQDQAGAEESNRMAADWVKQNIASLFSGPPEITAGAVTVHKSEAHDPIAVVNALDAACNLGDIESVMALFADDAILKDPAEPKVHTGKQQIREWFVPQMGHFQVATRDHRVTGNTVTWRGTLTGDIVRQMGSEVLEEAAEAVVQGGKITSFALTIVGRGGAK